MHSEIFRLYELMLRLDAEDRQDRQEIAMQTPELKTWRVTVEAWISREMQDMEHEPHSALEVLRSLIMAGTCGAVTEWGPVAVMRYAKIVLEVEAVTEDEATHKAREHVTDEMLVGLEVEIVDTTTEEVTNV